MRSVRTLLVLAAVASLLPVSGAVAQNATPASLYHLSKAVPIGAPDRWDYVLYENTAHRVYAAHGASIDVLDGGSGAKIGEVPVPGANGVAVVPGSGFGAPGHMRLSFACSMKTLEQALERMRRVITGGLPAGQTPLAATG